jgi:hypothetical protein
METYEESTQKISRDCSCGKGDDCCGGEDGCTCEEDIKDLSTPEMIAEYAGLEAELKSAKEKKFVALYKARSILSHIGTMTERRVSKEQLARMKKLGLKSM